jgi:peptide/nickel transport system permease protein
MVFIGLLVLVALLAKPISALVGYSPTQQDRVYGISPDGLPMPPSVHHWLGTDNLGRDILVRIVYGSQVSLAVGVGAAVVAVLVGVLVGMCAGFLGPAVDSVLARLMDVVLSFPFLLFAIALATVVGPSELLEIAVIAFFSWASVGRIVRGQTLAIREKEYVEAARSLGAGSLRIMVVDVLPNLVAPVIVYTTLLIPTAIVFEATLSFLGMGVVPPTPTWGNMLSDAQGFYQVAWWFLVFPGLALILTTLAFNLLGDSVRDALDPRAERLFA